MPFTEVLLSPLVLGLLGLCIGSFLNVVIHRLPLMLERGWPPDRGPWHPVVRPATSDTAAVTSAHVFMRTILTENENHCQDDALFSA